jgi:hypothetical protein
MGPTNSILRRSGHLLCIAGAVIAGFLSLPIVLVVAPAMLIYGSSWAEIGLTSAGIVVVCSGIGYSAPVWGIEVIGAIVHLLGEIMGDMPG